MIASHVRPDGDAIGSLLGLGAGSASIAGKSVQMVLVDGVSSSFRHLEGSELIVKEPTGEHDTFITVDCADFKRVGKLFENFGQPDINIDHHKTNENFGKLNLIEPEEVATSAILTNHLPAWGFKITKPIAAALVDRHYHRYAWLPHLEHQPFGIAPVRHADGNRRGYARPVYALAGAKIIPGGTLLGSWAFQPGTEEWNCVGYTHTGGSQEMQVMAATMMLI